MTNIVIIQALIKLIHIQKSSHMIQAKRLQVGQLFGFGFQYIGYVMSAAARLYFVVVKIYFSL